MAVKCQVASTRPPSPSPLTSGLGHARRWPNSILNLTRHVPGPQTGSVDVRVVQHAVECQLTLLAAAQVIQVRRVDFGDVSLPEKRVGPAEVLVTALAHIATDVAMTVAVIS